MGDLPPRLSEQQLFMLAYILHQEQESIAFRREFEDIVPISARSMLEFGIVDTERLSRALALEFDKDGDRISAPPDPPEERIERALDEGKPELAEFISRLANQPDHPNSRERHIRPTHSASFSRSLDRLEERDLVHCREGRGYREPTAVSVELTTDGREAAKEVLRRHSDGRYTLSFETLD